MHGDHEIFRGFSGGRSGLPHINDPQNQTLFMNVIDWLGEAPGLTDDGKAAVAGQGTTAVPAQAEPVTAE